MEYLVDSMDWATSPYLCPKILLSKDYFWRKTFSFQPIFSSNAVMGGVLGAGSAIGARMVLRQPLYARIHAFALQVTAGYWAGYQWNKWCSKKNMSEYKHAVDFAQRHSVSESDPD